jgi:hypothetical protein
MIQNKRVNWDSCQVRIPGQDGEGQDNRRVPFNPNGRLAAVLNQRSELGPEAFVFGSTNGTYQPNIQTAWESLKLLAYGVEPKPGRSVQHGTKSNCDGSTSAGTTCGTRAPVACWQTESISESFS